MSLVEIHGINKSYGAVQVLKDVTISPRARSWR